jgi:N-carbamoyl-L-amino-acid hydrolase
MSAEEVNTVRLVARLNELGAVGQLQEGGRTRLALTDEERQGRDLIVTWLHEAGAEVVIDKVGNIFGVLTGTSSGAPVMTGSHIDTVRRAGHLDGCYGVVAGIEVLDTIYRSGTKPDRSLVVAAFTNEEGVRFMPDLMGSRVLTKEMGLAEALQTVSTDGALFCNELERIGYAGTVEPWSLLPASYVELHIEQGPVLDSREVPIGIVEGVQGYTWWEVSISGQANHAGTTPMDLRFDAAVAAFELISEISRFVKAEGRTTVVTTGTISLHPNAINVIAGRANFTLDIRDANDASRVEAEIELRRLLNNLTEIGFDFEIECIAKNHAVKFNENICASIESSVSELGINSLRMVSGASHDAQMLARVCPTAMIFVPSRNGVSHNPEEHTETENLALGAKVLMKTIRKMINSDS